MHSFKYPTTKRFIFLSFCCIQTSTDEDANHSEDSDSDYVPMDTDEEKPHNNTDTLTTNLQQLLPKELTSNHSWMGFFKEQIKNCGPHKRWSIE